MQKIFKNFFVILIVLLFSFWIVLVYFLPFVLNTKFITSKICNYIFKQSGNVLYLKNSNIKVQPNLLFNFSCDEIFLINNKQILNLRHLTLSYSPFNSKINKITSDAIYFQKRAIDLEIKNNNSKSKFLKYENIQKLPKIYIKRIVINLKSSKKTSFDFDINNLLYDKNILTFNLFGSSDYLLQEIKIKSESKFYFLDDGIYVDNLKLYFLESIATIKGKIFDSKGNIFFSCVGKNLPVYDIERTVLLLLKRQNNKKYFIENFKNFKGKLDLSLYYENKMLYGIATLKNLYAKTIPLNIPLYFKKADFILQGKEIYMDSDGFFGGEKTHTNFYLTGLFTPSLMTSGSISSKVTNNFSKKYIEGLFIKGGVLLNVDYCVRNGVIDVIYNAAVESGSDVFYLKSRLGLLRYKRTVSAYTQKKNDVIKLLKYSYVVSNSKIDTEIITGSGIFTKHKNNKFAVDKISLKTKKDSPVSLLGFIESNLKGGKFNGDIEYDFNKGRLTGSLTLSNSRFKGFLIKQAAVFANKKSISILTYGTFKGEIYNAIIELKNSLTDSLYITDFDIFLKKFELTKTAKKARKFRPFLNEIDVKRTINIEKLTLRLDEFIKEKIVVKSLLLIGDVKNNVFNFKMDNALFAGGSLGATGYADFNSKTSSINFSAENIDAKTASYQVFNLNDHIRGTTSAKLRLDLYNNFKEYSGTAVFNLKKGSLTKFGTKEFMVKGSKKKQPFKFSLSKIIKIDKNAQISQEANIKGFFNFIGPQIKDVNIIVEHELFSFFIEGNYNIKTQYSCLNLWGRYDRQLEKNITIFHIPMSFVYKFVFKITDAKEKYFEKLLKIPLLKNTKDKTKTFSIKAEGNINDIKNLNIKFKDIR